MSGASTYYVEKQMPKAKAITRDFILGAVLVLCIMQILPESVSKSLVMLLSLSSLFNMKNSILSSQAVVNTLETIQVPKLSVPDFTGGTEDVDVRVGLPKF
jgi:hypothetical protein